MCGRFSLSLFEGQTFLDRFGIEKMPQMKPRYNIAPSQQTAAILDESPKEASLLKWGFIPAWAKDEKIGYSTINARAEDIDKKPTYSDSLKNKRCIVPADGFFEWDKKDKQPYRFVLPEGLFSFAGLWSDWRGIRTFTIITTAANSIVGKIHERMPVILHKQDEKKWLETGDLSLLKPYEGKMEMFPVSKLVGNPVNDTEAVIKPVWKKKEGLERFMPNMEH
jgi:putative SOS response-associated peptidase YedK